MGTFLRYSFLLLSLSFAAQSYGQKISFSANGQAEANLVTTASPLMDDEGPAPVKVEFSLPAIDLKPAADGFSTVTVKNLYSLDLPGNPDVGVTGSLFVIPPGYAPTLKILQQENRTLERTVFAPSQHKVRCNCEDNASFHFNSALYQSKSLFPSSVAKLEIVGNFQNVQYGRVRIQPLQQNFEDSSIRVTTRLSLEVSFTKVSTVKDKPVLTSLASHMAENLAPNAFDVINSSSKGKTDAETLVIFTFDDYVDALKPFVEWKKLRGLEVKLYTLSQVGGSREKAKDFLQKLYDESTVKPSYLLIVGDKTTFPAFEEKTTTGAKTQIAITDYPYSLLSGDDAIPDLLYGRLLVSNIEELQTQMTKILGFEKTSEQDGWYTHGTTIASDEGSEPSDKEYALQIQESLKKYTYREMDSFFQGDMTAKAEDVVKAVNSGRSWITYIGHGSGLSWGSLNDQFDLQTIETLTNSRHPILIDVACENANYKSFAVPFGKAWMVQTNSGKPVGASGYYGGSVSISWNPPAIMATGIAKTHFEKPAYSFGESVLAGQLYLIEKIGSNDQSIDNLRWYNLFGDPSMLLRTDKPKVLDVSRENSNERATLSILVTSNGEAVEGAVASVQKENGEITSIRTKKDGRAQLPVGTRLVVSGYNLETTDLPLK